METNPWTLVIVGLVVLALLVLIIFKNIKDRRDFYASLHASEDLDNEADESTKNIN